MSDPADESTTLTDDEVRDAPLRQRHGRDDRRRRRYDRRDRRRGRRADATDTGDDSGDATDTADDSGDAADASDPGGIAAGDGARAYAGVAVGPGRSRSSPVGRDEFLAEHLDRRPLILARDEPGRFDAVLSDDDVQRLVCETAIRSPAFRLVRDGAQLPLSGYTRDIAWRPGSFSGTAFVDRVAASTRPAPRSCSRRCTCTGIRLRCTAAAWSPASAGRSANAYCTPAGAQGSAVHHDTHDVLVLQVSGDKRWRIYTPSRRAAAQRPALVGGRHRRGRRAVARHHAAGGRHALRPARLSARGDLRRRRLAARHVGLHPPTRLDVLRAALGQRRRRRRVSPHAGRWRRAARRAPSSGSRPACARPTSRAARGRASR